MVALVHDSLRVSLRLCPDRNKETQDIERNDGISVMEDGKTVSFFTAKKQTTFNFTHTFDQFYDDSSSQERVYDNSAAHIVQRFMPKSGEFHDGILIAFGQTGSGKHHTMLGNEGSSDGLIHLLVEDLFQLLRNEASDLGSSKFEVKCSSVEVSRNEVKNLLVSTEDRKECDSFLKNSLFSLGKKKLIDEQDSEGIIWRSCKTEHDVIQELENKSISNHRKPTNSLFSLMVQNISNEDGKVASQGMIHMVTMAGNEKKIDGNVPFLANENQIDDDSFSALENVISAAYTGESFSLPNQPNKLLHILQDYIKLDSTTSLVLNVSKKNEDREETIRTVEFGARIQNRVLVPRKQFLVEREAHYKTNNDVAMSEYDSQSVEDLLSGGGTVIVPSVSSSKDFISEESSILSFQPSMVDSVALEIDFDQEKHMSDTKKKSRANTNRTLAESKSVGQVQGSSEIDIHTVSFAKIGKTLSESENIEDDSSLSRIKYFIMKIISLVKFALIILFISLMLQYCEETVSDSVINEPVEHCTNATIHISSVNNETVNERILESSQPYASDAHGKIQTILITVNNILNSDIQLDHLYYVALFVGACNFVSTLSYFFAKIWNLFWFMVSCFITILNYLKSYYNKSNDHSTELLVTPKKKTKVPKQFSVIKSPRIFSQVNPMNVFLSRYTGHVFNRNGYLVEVTRSARTLIKRKSRMNEKCV